MTRLVENLGAILPVASIIAASASLLAAILTYSKQRHFLQRAAVDKELAQLQVRIHAISELMREAQQSVQAVGEREFEDHKADPELQKVRRALEAEQDDWRGIEERVQRLRRVRVADRREKTEVIDLD
jgi:biopolymer transport protein ExbB/TolQ